MPHIKGKPNKDHSVPNLQERPGRPTLDPNFQPTPNLTSDIFSPGPIAVPPPPTQLEPVTFGPPTEEPIPEAKQVGDIDIPPQMLSRIIANGKLTEEDAKALLASGQGVPLGPTAGRTAVPRILSTQEMATQDEFTRQVAQDQILVNLSPSAKEAIRRFATAPPEADFEAAFDRLITEFPEINNLPVEGLTERQKREILGSLAVASGALLVTISTGGIAGVVALVPAAAALLNALRIYYGAEASNLQQFRDVSDRVRADAEKNIPSYIASVRSGGDPATNFALLELQGRRMRDSQALIKRLSSTQSGAELSASFSQLVEIEDFFKPDGYYETKITEINLAIIQSSDARQTRIEQETIERIKQAAPPPPTP